MLAHRALLLAAILSYVGIADKRCREVHDIRRERDWRDLSVAVLADGPDNIAGHCQTRRNQPFHFSRFQWRWGAKAELVKIERHVEADRDVKGD